MALFYPDIFEHSNQNFALLDATQLRGSAYPLADLADTGSIPPDKMKVGTIVFTSASGKYYGFTGLHTSSWDTPSNWSEFVLSGAGGTDLSGTFSGSFSGSFEGDGSGLTGVVYSNLDNVPSGIVSASILSYPGNQGTVRLTTNGVAATAVGLGLETDDNVTFNQVTASSGVQVENNFNLSSPNVSSIVLSNNVLDGFVQGDNFIIGGGVLSEEDNSTIRRTVALGSDALKSGSGKLFDNTVIGYQAIQYISESRGNTAIGESAGTNSSLYLTSSNNTFIGKDTSYTNDVSNATAIGYNTVVAQSNTVILGNSADVGIGTSTPNAKLDVQGNISGSGQLQIENRVGIGKNAPGAKLHIKGEGNTSATTALLVQNLGENDLLKVLDNGHITLSNVTGSSFTGSFTGDGSGLTGVDYSNLTSVPSGIVSSSTQIVSNLVGQDVVVQSMSGSFSGSFEGDGSGLTNVPASGVVGLNLTRISTTNVTASVSEGADSFKLVSGSETPFKIDNSGITSGSFKGDGSGLTGVAYSNLTSVPVGIVSGSVQVDHDATTNFVADEHVDHSSVSIIAGAGLTGGGTISSSRTIDVVSANNGIVANSDNIELDTASSTFTDGVKTKLNTETVISGSSQVNFFDLDNLPSGIVSQSLLNDLTNGEVNQLKNINGTTIDATKWGYLGALNQPLSTGDNVVFRDGRFTGDLTVQGTVTSLQTTDLNVEDQFILLNSGSAEGSSGLIFGGANEIAQQGPSLFWNADYNTGDGRLAVTSSMAWNDTSPSTDYHLAGVFEGSEANAIKAKADHVGNIRVENEEIYIYV